MPTFMGPLHHRPIIYSYEANGESTMMQGLPLLTYCSNAGPGNTDTEMGCAGEEQQQRRMGEFLCVGPWREQQISGAAPTLVTVTRRFQDLRPVFAPGKRCVVV
jgi:hypothetical protein